jgi:hypothetical protein
MRVLRLIAMNAAVLVALLIVIEAVAGVASLIRGGPPPAGLAERRHTRYDPLLGWSNTPGLDVPDMYGPGVRLRINHQGFRNDRDFAREVPEGRRRAICVGDSFTLGYGVSNDQTWCELLSSLDPRLETVNMGQGGYGIDQAYLWYERDGGSLQHHLTILAFIGEDLPRASAVAYAGYAKPRLAIDGDRLAVTGVPVAGPADPRLRRWLERVQRLRTARALGEIKRMTGLGGQDEPDLSLVETQRIIARLLADLRRLTQQRSSRLILVFLPTELDLIGPDTDWVPPVARRAQELGIPFFDLSPDFHAVPADERARLFIQKGQLDYPGSEGHYTVAGNALVARVLNQKLQGLVAP